MGNDAPNGRGDVGTAGGDVRTGAAGSDGGAEAAGLEGDAAATGSERVAGASDPEGEAEASDRDVAARVVVSYPEDLSRWGRMQVEKPSFRAFLRKVRERAREGDIWEEFVGVGCCGNTLDVPLRVERVEGGSRLGPDTGIDFEVREACDVEGSWRVQSAGGPRRADE